MFKQVKSSFLQSRTAAAVIFSLVLLLSSSCRNKIDKEYKGTELTMGNGKVYPWILVDYTGKPKSVGFTMSASALEGLPTSGPGHEHHNAWIMPLFPAAVAKTPFTHIVINWNPEGHEPKPIYAESHFDFHFYTMSNAERLTIGAWATDSVKLKKPVPADYMPANYIFPGAIAAESIMGSHWIDATSHELQPPPNNRPFDYHFVYGSYDGKVNFIEPMVTMNFFRAISDRTWDVPRPAKVNKSGYYPRKLRIYQADGNYIMSLEDMEYRTGE